MNQIQTLPSRGSQAGGSPSIWGSMCSGGGDQDIVKVFTEEV